MKLTFSVFCLFFLFVFAGVSVAQDELELAETSKYCLGCHSSDYYSFENSWTGMVERKRMNPYLRIDSTGFITGVHGSFACDDCHSPDYTTYPHNAELKLEFKYTCQDCHAGDPAYAHLNFDGIEIEAMNSVHAERMGDAFKCEMCHSPHTNKLVATSHEYTISEIVAANNGVCLSCHLDESRFHLYGERERPIIEQTHDWLPNQELHFKNVRCIECHTPVNDTLMVAHEILAKEHAVRNCAECHSANSMLQDKLYKYMAMSSVEQEGIKGSFRNEAYLIGAHRNRLLNLLSIVIFGMGLLGIFAHALARIIKRK